MQHVSIEGLAYRVMHLSQICLGVRLVLFLLLLLLLPGCASGNTPVIFRVSDPILPGQTALLFGDDLGKRIVVTGQPVADDAIGEPQTGAPLQEIKTGEKLRVLQSSDLSVKVIIPDNWKQGEYALQIRSSTGSSAVIYLNRTEPWWWRGDGEDGDAQAGHEIRVFGKNFGEKTRAWLEVGAKKMALTSVKAAKYAAIFRLPAEIHPGSYKLWVHNGYGGQAGFGTPLEVKVVKPANWPKTVYNVRELGAKGDGVKDDTEAIRAALDRARQNGGGVVSLPAGRYRISGGFVMPPHTVLKGEKRETVTLFAPDDTPEFSCVVVGTGDFAVEDLTIVARSARAMICCPQGPPSVGPVGSFVPGPGGHNMHLARLNLQHLRYAGLEADDPRMKEVRGPHTIAARGSNMVLEDLDVTSSGMPIQITDAKRCRVEKCHLRTGRSGWCGIWNLVEGDIEGNEIEAIDPMGNLSGVEDSAYHVYVADNWIHDAKGGGREALTFDAPYLVNWIGGIESVDGSEVTLSGAHLTPVQLNRTACVIVRGKGIGQCIPIVSGTENRLTLASSWAVPPDSSSILTVQTNKSDVVVYHNRFADSNVAVQLYSQCIGFIVDANQADQTSGSYSMGWDFNTDKGRRLSTCYFDQWLNNHFSHGFVNQYGTKHEGMLGPNVEIIGLDKPITPEHILMMLGNIIRDNQAEDLITVGVFNKSRAQGQLRLVGDLIGRDNIIEGNTVTDASIGVEIDQYFYQTVARKNTIKGGGQPFVDRGIDTWTDAAR